MNMPSGKTQNYQLNQWEKSDQVLMDDFNADNLAIDGALKALDSGKASTSSLSGLQSTVTQLSGTLSSLQTTVGKKQDASSALKLAVGNYTGTTVISSSAFSGSQDIPVGFKPKAVLAIEEDGEFYTPSADGYVYGGLAVTDAPGKKGSNIFLEITSSGFRVYSSWNGSFGTHYCLNNNGESYNCIAIG